MWRGYAVGGDHHVSLSNRGIVRRLSDCHKVMPGHLQRWRAQLHTLLVAFSPIDEKRRGEYDAVSNFVAEGKENNMRTTRQFSRRFILAGTAALGIGGATLPPAAKCLLLPRMLRQRKRKYSRSLRQHLRPWSRRSLSTCTSPPSSRCGTTPMARSSTATQSAIRMCRLNSTLLRGP